MGKKENLRRKPGVGQEKGGRNEEGKGRNKEEQEENRKPKEYYFGEHRMYAWHELGRGSERGEKRKVREDTAFSLKQIQW